jgi:hypothetical protein
MIVPGAGHSVQLQEIPERSGGEPSGRDRLLRAVRRLF